MFADPPGAKAPTFGFTACTRAGSELLSGMNTPAPRPRRLIRATTSAIHGRGVYATQPIPRGARVVEYTGERITKAEAVRREQARLRRLARGGDGSVYIFVLNRRHDLDGRTGRNIARLINHSCSPNCEAFTIRGHIWIFARRDIAPGEELTFDYGFPLSEWRLHPCRCGSSGCPGYIVSAGQRKRLRRLIRAERSRTIGRTRSRAGARTKSAG